VKKNKIENGVRTNNAIVELDYVVKYVQQNNIGISAFLMKDLHSLKKACYLQKKPRQKIFPLHNFFNNDP